MINTSRMKTTLLLGAPIDDSTQLSDTDFETLIVDYFYSIILLHNEHIYAETGDQAVDQRIEDELRSLEEKQRDNLLACFTDARFISVLATLKSTENTEILMQFTQDHLERSRIPESEMGFIFEDISLSLHQALGSFLGLQHSILDCLIQIYSETPEFSENRLQHISNIVSLKAIKQAAHDIGEKYKKQKPIAGSEHHYSMHVVTQFLEKRINSPQLRVIDFCYNLVDRLEDYKIKQGSQFSYKAYLFDSLFLTRARGFRDLQVKNINLWMSDFFVLILDTFNKMTDDSLLNCSDQLDNSFQLTNDAEQLSTAIDSLYGNEVEVYREVKNVLHALLSESSLPLNDDIKAYSAQLTKMFIWPYVDFTQLNPEKEQQIRAKFLINRHSADMTTPLASCQNISTVVTSQLLDTRHGHLRADLSQPIESEMTPPNSPTPTTTPTNEAVVFQTPSKKKYEKEDITLIILGIIAIAIGIYLILQTCGAPVFIGGITAAMQPAVVGSTIGGGILSILTGLRRKIRDFFRGRPRRDMTSHDETLDSTCNHTDLSATPPNSSPTPEPSNMINMPELSKPQKTPQSNAQHTAKKKTASTDADTLSADMMIHHGNGIFIGADKLNQEKHENRAANCCDLTLDSSKSTV